jgi:glycosyltransferase involved in cell wall biosynthesis
MPQTSICIPTRNRAGELRNALQHLTTFNRLDFEVVVSDNHSDDDTPAVVESFRDKLPSLYYFRQNEPLNFHETQSPPFNLAVGDYLVYLSDDDILLEDGVLEAVAALEADPSLAVLYCAWQEVTDGVLGTKHQDVETAERYSFTDLLHINEQVRAVEMPIMRRTAYEKALPPRQFQFGFDLFALSQLLKVGDMMVYPTLTHLVTRHAGQASTQLYRGDILQCYLADYELLAANTADLDPLNAMISISEKMSEQYVVAAQRALDDMKFMHARTLVARASAYGNRAARRWIARMDGEMWPLVVADAAVAYAKTAGSVTRIVAEHTSETEPVIAALSKLATPMDVLSGGVDELMFLPWSDDEFFFYSDVNTLRLREAVTGAPVRKARSLQQLRSATGVGGQAEGEGLCQAAS